MILRGNLLALSALALASCAAQPQAEAETGGFDPALFVVRDPDSTMYLFGTVHVRPNGADWADDDVRDALAATEEIWTEVHISPEGDAEAQALALRIGRAPPGRPLSSWLTAEENARLNALTQRLNIPTGALEQFQPWMAALTLTLVPVMQAGYSPTSGVDRQVDAFGDANGKRMRALETVEQQLGFFASLSEDVQRQILREAIADAEEGPALITAMTVSWERGDLESLEGAVITDMRDSYPELYEEIFVTRNHAWMTTLTAELAGAGVDFVAVGAGHLLGEDGLVEQFRARGFTVERVE